MFEEASAMEGTLKLCKLTQAELAKRMGVSQSYVANKLRLLGFSDGERTLILSLGLSERHARSILRLGTDKRRDMIIKVAERGLTVRECEAMVDGAVAVQPIIPPSRRNRLDALGSFRDGVRKGVEHLSSIGVDAHMEITSFGKRSYITVTVTEE